jgi:ornithine cyclodeaminase/alanine dehydrogenase-like protein (mu-crystallin family)
LKWIDAKAVTSAATLPEWLDAIERALRADLAGEVLVPERLHIDRGNNSFLMMPCITGEYWVTKLVSFCPENRSLGLPSIFGTIVLASAKTGEPLAMLEGSNVTAFRTAAVSGVAIRHLAPDTAAHLGIIGAGAQAVQQARFACAAREIRKITVYDPLPEAVAHFKSALNRDLPGANIAVAEDSNAVCRASDIIITATNSKNPVIPDQPELLEARTFMGIGSYKPDAREYPDSFFSLIDQVFVDTLHAKKESGDLIQPLRKGLIKEDRIHSLAELVAGKVLLSTRTTRFCKTVGSALFDAVAAQLIYEKTSGT